MLIWEKKTDNLRVRIEPETKEALQKAAANAGMSSSALALRAIKDLLREGKTHVILPDHLRVTKTEMELRKERTKADWKVLRKEMRQLRARKKANAGKPPAPHRAGTR